MISLAGRLLASDLGGGENFASSDSSSESADGSSPRSLPSSIGGVAGVPRADGMKGAC